MGEEIRIETKLSFIDFWQFEWFMVMCKGSKFKVFHLITMAVFFGMLVTLIALFNSVKIMGDVVFLIFFLVLVPDCLVLSFLYWKILGQLLCRIKHTHKFEFKRDSVTIETLGGEATLPEDVPYDSLKGAYYSKQAFFLLTDEGQGYLLPKRDMGGETAERLDSLLREKVGERYWKCWWWGL